MGTRSMIGMQTDMGIVGTYCHWDGYLSHNGKILQDHYNTPERALAVSRAGYISALEADLEKSIAESANTDKPSNHKTERGFISYAAGSDCEYAYLFKDGKWFWCKPNRREAAFIELAPHVAGVELNS